MYQTKGRFKLLITISVLFTTLIVIFGLIFRQYTYSKMSEIILGESTKYFSQINEALSLEFSSTANIAAQSVQIMSQTGVGEASTLDERLSFLPLFKTALTGHSEMSGLEVGYDSGDFFIVRHLYSDQGRKRFDAPFMADYVVDNITDGQDGEKYLQRLWFSHSLAELKRSKPEKTTYDPRLRPWFKVALSSTQPVATRPYLFHFTHEMGITVAYRSPQGNAVIAGDLTLTHISHILAKYQPTSHSEIVLLEKKGEDYWVTAYKEPEQVIRKIGGLSKRSMAKELDSPIFQLASEHPDVLSPYWEIEYEGQRWLGSTQLMKTPNSKEERYYLATILPEEELFHEAKKAQNQAMTFTFLMILFTIPLTLLLAKRISHPIQQLARDADRIRRFDFQSHELKNSNIKEVHELDRSMHMMEITINKFIQLITSLSSEKDFGKLLRRITEETMNISEADGAFSYIVDETMNTLELGSVSTRLDKKISSSVFPAFDLQEDTALVRALSSDNRLTSSLSELFASSAIEDQFGLKNPQVVVLPLRNRQNENIGLLCLLLEHGGVDIDSTEHSGRLAFIEALSGFAAVTLESRKMLLTQKELLESFIKLIAGAIDSKSPYTGGHCQRVPVITKLLAEKACEVKEGVFADVSFSDEEWEAIHIASWLHDCGKVTTPEYVVDKATKLETIYDRIHEVRTRFEVLKRDAHIRFFEELATGGDQEQLQKILNKEWDELDADFSFVAECNLGGEFMAPEKVEQLKRISERTWMRTLSDRIGISWEELLRKERQEENSLPALERLLDDRKDHLYMRDEKQRISEDNDYGFKLNVPEHLYNKGELYNLSIARGTLNDEERYQINDHIVQTIIMLKKLPYPRHLVDVPDIAGGHHEKINGSGYPRKLHGDEMSMPAKMMVIADIFEALTASDRPYKKAKKLSEAIKIMGFMLKDQHIDGDLFRLFLSSGVYKQYAEEYLMPDQIDEVDISQYLEN